MASQLGELANEVVRTPWQRPSDGRNAKNAGAAVSESRAGTRHHRLDQRKPVEGEGRQSQRPDRESQQEQRVVVGRAAIGVQHAATGAPVNEHPLPLAAHGDGNRFHGRAAIRGPVA